jgi:hypothetical protein
MPLSKKSWRQSQEQNNVYDAAQFNYQVKIKFIIVDFNAFLKRNCLSNIIEFQIIYREIENAKQAK